MESKKVNKYEEQRLANIKQNANMLAALKIHSTITQLNDLSKRHKRKYTKKPRNDSHVVRTSLRCRGIAPQEIPTKTPKIRQSPISSVLEPGAVKMRDAFVNSSGLDNCKLIERILGVSKNSYVGYSTDNALEVTEKGDNSTALDSLRLGPQKIARFFQGKIFSLRFFPSNDKRMIVVGGDYGNLGFWDVDSVDDGDRMYVYRPHSGPVSGIVFQHFSTSKIFTSSYDGCIRLMDVERETFDLAYHGDHSICSLSQRPNNVKSLYFGEGQGKVNVWDETSGKSSSLWSLHEGRINSIDFNAHNTNIMATSSSDRTACIWDLRKVNVNKPEPISTVNHKRAVHSAFFSPSGSLLATTSFDHTVGLLGGANYDRVSMLSHTNGISTPLRGSWGWDDRYIFIGNMKGGIDAISTVTNRCIDTLRSPEMTAIPRFFEKHPANVGMLAGVTHTGLVYLWTPS
ncbi:DROUGHT SENSITIVE 1 [Heracleum sosnowskyi]|uniref:DROUGHT SENSITIVE 1 n=1 Tax=Heracleum sosnowskyi TaxID=360622 RepID=A0AAD8N5V7_9APIA|nr:DROUGHT SENSITIVE 1 [Heracleum sosnowskyi]